MDHIREQAAVKAMAAILSGLTSHPAVLINYTQSAERRGTTVPKIVAETAVTYADALIKELEGR